MNDVQYVEAARKFAERVVIEGGQGVEQRVVYAFRAVMSRHPSDRELQSLTTLFRETLAEFQGNSEAAGLLLATGESPRNEQIEPVELAAWTMVANLILNLDETLTKG